MVRDDDGTPRVTTREVGRPDALATDYLASELVAQVRRTRDRIVWNPAPGDDDGGNIDELVIHDATVHIEQMDTNCWWIGVRRGDAEWNGNFFCDETGMRFTQQESTGFDFSSADTLRSKGCHD